MVCAALVFYSLAKSFFENQLPIGQIWLSTGIHLLPCQLTRHIAFKALFCMKILKYETCEEMKLKMKIPLVDVTLAIYGIRAGFDV